MPRRAGWSRLLIAALFAAACSDAAGPAQKRAGPGGPLFSFSPNGVGQSAFANGSLNEPGTELAKGFDPKNPRHGDAVIATFFWLGSSSIDSVIDFVADLPNTRARNTFHRVDSVTAGGYTMVTYVATNIQNFPDSSSVSGQIYAVRAYLHQPVTDGGVKISAWRGIEDNFALALRDVAHLSGTGVGADIPAHSPPVAVNAGGLVYTATMGTLDTTGSPQAFAGVLRPGAPFGPMQCLGGVDCTRSSDRYIMEDAVYAVQASAGTVDPTWTWQYAPTARPWLLTTLSLNAATSGSNQGPTAAFTSSCSNPTCNFTNASSDPDGSIGANSWSFGDGQSSNLASPSHNYATAGTYNVTLTVTDNQGASNSVSHSVVVPAANQAPAAAFSSSCTNLTCSFTNASGDPDGTIAANSWDFGDGATSGVASPTHSYTTAGTYTVTLTVADNQGATNSVSHPVTVTVANQPPTAAFTSSCSNLTCGFTNTSSDPDGSIVANSWTFGDGATSGVASPTHSYTAAGVYTVTLTVTDNQGASNSVSHTVTVTAPNQPPTAAFTSSCSNLTCAFTNSSSDPDGTISTYSWTFGDGATSTLASPSHSYTNPGTYTVTLTVTDNQNASNSVSHTVTVTAPNQSPTANFTFSCSVLTCSFTSTSSDPDGTIATYSWTFGDGGSSAAQNPTHSYPAGGTYTVSLRVTDNQGASSTTTSRNVSVTAPNQAPTANFTFSCSALTCNFTSTSSDPDGTIATYSWTFGDGATSTAQNPSHSYTAGGSYTVTLTVTDDQGASGAPASRTVGVAPPNQPPAAAFTSSCTTLTCSFTNTSSDPDGSISANSWNFGDGTTSIAANPSHSYTTAGTYTVTLTVTDNQGAANSVSHNVTVTAPNQPPVAAFSSSCSTLTCSFTNTSSDPDGSVSTNSWNFGDGQTSSAVSPSHSYTAAGTYTVTLTVTDNQNATNSVSHTVTVTAPNQPPTANFTFSCSALNCSFTNTSSDPDGSIASSSWNFGDGTTSTAANPSHSYTTAGTYTVTLRVTDNQGATSPTTSKSVTVTPPNQPPTANFTFSCSALSCSFTSTSSDPDGSIASYSWNFGDGTTSTAANPSHSYAAGGTYTVSLRVTDNQGAQSSTTSKNVTVTTPPPPPPPPPPNSPPVVNAGSDQTAVTGLLYSSTQSFSDANGNGPWSYRIDWGDGSVSTGTRTAQGSFTVGHTYVIVLPRSFTITVTITDAAGASGSDSKVVSVLLL